MADIFNHLWQSTMFAVGVALLCVACRHNRARLRYGLWFVASAKFLVPFAALAAVGSLVQWQQAPAPIRSVVASPGVRDFNAPFAAMWQDPTPMVTAAAHTAVDRAVALRHLALRIHGDRSASGVAVARDPRCRSRRHAVHCRDTRACRH